MAKFCLRFIVIRTEVHDIGVRRTPDTASIQESHQHRQLAAVNALSRGRQHVQCIDHPGRRKVIRVGSKHDQLAAVRQVPHNGYNAASGYLVQTSGIRFKSVSNR